MASTPNVTNAPIDAAVQLTSAVSTTVPTAVYTAPAATSTSTGGAKIGVFRAISNDTAKSFNLSIYKTIASVDHLLGVVTVGVAASAVSPSIVDILSLIRGTAMNLGAGTALKVMPDAVPTSGKVIEIEIEGATF